MCCAELQRRRMLGRQRRRAAGTADLTDRLTPTALPVTGLGTGDECATV